MAAAKTTPAPAASTGRRTPDAAQRLDRVLTNDPGMGVVRHADAGYDIARRVARERGVDMPML